ncbi:hypothetical protein DPMN_131074 [Dreissena polymorpha]|uniref:Uncharacterized protein n=1 Tax=Dreissena polymorpha TaxID=45954 RepID=A0A9D4JYZ3_DREPO|nr:hypothetical protein DPMN_131074 [Dreissena polymorpha]
MEQTCRSLSESFDESLANNIMKMASDTKSEHVRKKKRKSKYSLLEAKFDRLEGLVMRVLGKVASSPPHAQIHAEANSDGRKWLASCHTETNSESRKRHAPCHTETNSDNHVRLQDDVLSILVDADSDDSYSDTVDNGENLAETTKQCLFEMFGEDALVKHKPLKEGICLDDSQLKVLNTSFRCDQPNFLTAFNEESVDMLPVDESCEKTLKVPSLDKLVDGCLTKRYGQKVSFAKNKGNVLFTQPCKMVDKICFKGQHAAGMGIVMQCYLQQGPGSLLTSVQTQDLDKETIVQKVKDVFAISTKVLDQLGRTGAFHHIARRAVAMTDTGLYEQYDNLQFSNLPLSGDGVFGPGLEHLLKARKEKKKQVDDLIPDVRRPKQKISIRF